jgi:hypothetical protein
VTRRVASTVKLVLLLVGLLCLAAVPARAAESLTLTCAICTQVVATGKDLPASTTVRLLLVDVRTGQQVGPTHSIQTDAQGAFVEKITVDLSRHPSLESSVWRSDGQVLVVAAHNRIAAPCKNGKMLEMGEMGGMGGMGETLAFTGAHTPELLGLGFGLLAAGAALVVVARRRPARAYSSRGHRGQTVRNVRG